MIVPSDHSCWGVYGFYGIKDGQTQPPGHFVLPERHGIAPRCAYLWLEDDRLFIRASNGIPVPRVEVNHQRLAVDEARLYARSYHMDPHGILF